MSLYKSFGKRALDIVASASALLLLSPLLLGLTLLVRARLGRPALFVQQRSGLGGRPFRLFKFRSMLDARDERGELLPDEHRLTPFGNWLRASSLDELPGFWNVLKGEMSLVGPRPLHTHYDALYNARQKRRLEVRPGITGWAQVNGRNAITWPDKLELDVWYVENLGLWTDLRIILATVRSVLLREGINSGEAATMPAFLGEAGSEPAAPRADR
jgi:lipopolysaccharide/colanic/teichoic acid biosynthesis glycosyltransferase